MLDFVVVVVVVVVDSVVVVEVVVDSVVVDSVVDEVDVVGLFVPVRKHYINILLYITYMYYQ